MYRSSPAVCRQAVRSRESGQVEALYETLNMVEHEALRLSLLSLLPNSNH